jgi:hypothetical protein
MLFMRIGNMFLAAALALAAFPFRADAAGSRFAVAIQYTFAGAADLAGNSNFNQVKAVFSTPPARHFQDLVLDRWAGVFWNALQLDPGGDSTALLRPLFNDLVQAESMGSFGGHDSNRMDFVLAARLDAKSAASWQHNLEQALHGKGEALTEEGFSGQRWNRPGNNAIWIFRARDWTVAGRGEDLLPVRTEYLQHIKLDNRPAPVKKESWLHAAVDWPRLAYWAPLAHCPLKLARTIVDLTASKGRLRATASVSYPEAVPWQPPPWRVPKGLVSDPLSSFTAARDLAPYLQSNETLSRLSDNPLAGQLYCWALRTMPLLSYAAWPVTDATNLMRKLGTEAPAVLNPALEARNHTQLTWKPKKDQLFWNHIPVTGPTLQATHDKSGDFLLAELFPIESKLTPPPDQLWSQFEGHGDLVYYDWEVTGLRLQQWRLLSELLPVFPTPSPEDAARRQKAAQNAKLSPLNNQPQTPMLITDSWLAALTLPPANTVTEVTRTSPTELTLVRYSQFLFTGFELMLLSHWLADAPVGPIDLSLLPTAKMTGPGLPSARPPPQPPARPPANFPARPPAIAPSRPHTNAPAHASTNGAARPLTNAAARPITNAPPR